MTEFKPFKLRQRPEFHKNHVQICEECQRASASPDGHDPEAGEAHRTGPEVPKATPEQVEAYRAWQRDNEAPTVYSASRIKREPSASPDGYVSVGELEELRAAIPLLTNAGDVRAHIITRELDSLIAKAGERLACPLQAEHDEVSAAAQAYREALKEIEAVAFLGHPSQERLNIIGEIARRAISQSREKE